MVKRPYGTPQSNRHRRDHIGRVKGAMERRESHTREFVTDDLGKIRIRCLHCKLPHARWGEFACERPAE